MTTYTVLGTGAVGQALSGKLATLGHEVSVGTRDPDATRARQDVRWAPGVVLLDYAAAAGRADVVLNATSGLVSLEVLGGIGAEALAGKVLIDVSNPLDFTGGFPPVLRPVNDDSLGEQLQRAFPETFVVKTLNTMTCSVMVDPARVPGEHHVFVSGDDLTAKAEVTRLLAEFGWPSRRVIDLGDITTARGPEMWLALWVRLYGALGHADFNLAISGV